MRILYWICGVAAALAAGYALFTFTVSTNEFAVVTRFGKPVSVISEPGFHLRWPPGVEEINRIDKRVQLYESRLVENLTKDKKNVIFKFFVSWKVSDPRHFFLSVRNSEKATEKIDDILSSKSGAAIGDIAFDDIISLNQTNKFRFMEQRITQDVASMTKEHYGVDIVEVGVSQLALPESNARAVYRRMRAERNAIAKKYRAEGEEQAAIIKAEAERAKSDILAKAELEAMTITSQGEEEAARIYAEAFSKDPEFYRFWKTMETYQTILDRKTTLVLSQESELFKYLKE